MNGAKTFFDSSCQSNRVLWISARGPLKIRLRQCCVVLWIHNFDEICRLNLTPLKLN